jgi:multidrug efflux pump subunit AcrB
MCMRPGSWANRSFDGFFVGLDRLCTATLARALRGPAVVIIVGLALLVGNGFRLRQLPEELAPVHRRVEPRLPEPSWQAARWWQVNRLAFESTIRLP